MRKQAKKSYSNGVYRILQSKIAVILILVIDKDEKHWKDCYLRKIRLCKTSLNIDGEISLQLKRINRIHTKRINHNKRPHYFSIKFIIKCTVI